MIDIHSHILPMVDDGAKSVEEALAMIIMAYESGTDVLFLTPHLAYPYDFVNPKEKVKELFSDLKRIVKEERIPIQLYCGCEFLFSSVEDYKQYRDEITTLNDSKYLLMEFYFDVTCDLIQEAVECVKKDGFIPILAHPERYECIQIDPQFAIDLSQHGVCLQMNKGSVLGNYGRNTYSCVNTLLNEHAYSFVGSDAHQYDWRTPRLNQAYEWMIDHYGSTYTKKLFKTNALMLIKEDEDEEIS